MNGRGDRLQDKWGSINNTMKKHQIAILGIQETHPCDKMQEVIGRRFRNTMHIIHSADPEAPNTTGGVSIALQKSMIDIKNVSHCIIIPGRVIMADIPCNENNRLRIMNIYAPAKNAEKTDFWKSILRIIERDENLRPDVVVGDFNLIENPEIDRLRNSGRANPQTAREAMSEFNVELNLADGWR